MTSVPVFPSAWFAAPVEVTLDHDGPAGRPYVPPAADFAERPICVLFAEVVARLPERVAVSNGTTALSFAALAQWVAALAGRIAANVPRGQAVAVLLPNSSGSLVAVLACAAAGRVCLVLNAEHPPLHNAEILTGAHVSAAIVAHCETLAELPGCAEIRPILLADGAAAVPTVLPEPLTPDEPAIVLYTSGSTGRPKGIALSQRTVLSRVANNIRAMHLGPEDRLLSLGALGTTAGLVASVIALLCGASQFLMPAASAGISKLLGLVRAERISVMWGVPAVLRMLFSAPGAVSDLTSLRLIRTFGERLLQVELDAWRRILPSGCHIAVTYGQTEVTVAQWFVPLGYRSDGPIVPVGYLLPEHHYSIRDAGGRPAGPGEIGELVVRGRCVAHGEWHSGRCEPGRAIPDPEMPEERVLRTGDLVRLRPDRLLEIIGRVDRLIKVHGMRVEPAEIEAFLRRQLGVADVALVVRRREDDADLIAAVVATPGHGERLAAELRAAIRTELPGHMRPHRIDVLTALPRLPGGKIDEAALLALT